MYIVLLFLADIGLSHVRIDSSGDTTVKMVSLYPVYPGIKDIESKIIELTNYERKKKSLPELNYNRNLMIAARQHSYEMLIKDYFSHISPLDINRIPVIRMYNAGIISYKTGENIAKQAGNLLPVLLENNRDSIARDVVYNWMNSSEHRKNILDEDYSDIGVGVSNDDSILMITQNFSGNTGLEVDSVLVKSKSRKYILYIYTNSCILDINVFVDEKLFEKNDYEVYNNHIKVPLLKNSGEHKIEFCFKDGSMYECIMRLFVDSDDGWDGLFPPIRHPG